MSMAEFWQVMNGPIPGTAARTVANKKGPRKWVNEKLNEVILAFLEEHGKSSTSRIAAALKIRPTPLSVHLNDLKNGGEVSRSRIRGDRNIYWSVK